MIELTIRNSCSDYQSYRAARVKSLFNVESGANFALDAKLPIDEFDWQLGLIVGPSGSGKTSIGRRIFDGVDLHDPMAGWNADRPVIDDIAPQAPFDDVTAALAAVGLGSVPAWLRPFAVLSNGERFRADLARVICSGEPRVVIDEFTSVVDRQIARVGAHAFSKSWKRTQGRKCVLLSCHYDIVDWSEPDWTFDTATGEFARRALRRPKFELQIWKTDKRYWNAFEPHYYLKLPAMIAAEYFVGTVDGMPVCHVAVSPWFHNGGYRASRLVVLPEWQGAAIGMKFLNAICEMHLRGDGRRQRCLPTFFHTTHPGLVSALRRDRRWIQVSSRTHGTNRKYSHATIQQTGNAAFKVGRAGFGGHFRAVQGFKYRGEP